MLDETSPSGLRWKKSCARRVKPGDVAGAKKSTGYWLVGISTDKPRHYLAHRIVYYLQTGVDPGEHEVDHVIGVENPLELRLATHTQNLANQKSAKGASSTYKGTTWDRQSRKWRAQIRVNQKLIYLGCFKDEKAAAVAYNKAAVKYFGEFARVNVIDD